MTVAHQHQLALQRISHQKNPEHLLNLLADHLLQRIDYLKCSPQSILNISTNIKACSTLLTHKFPNTKIEVCHSLDDLYRVDSNSMDCIFANAFLPLIYDYENFWQECLRVLKPNGVLLFSTVGPGSLSELRASLKAFTHENSMNIYVDLHDLGDGLMHAGFQDPAVESEIVELHYASFKKLLHELKNLGSIKLWSDYPHLYYGKEFWPQLENFYRENFSSATKKLVLSFEIYYGIAFAKDQRQFKEKEEVSIPISAIKRRK